MKGTNIKISFMIILGCIGNIMRLYVLLGMSFSLIFPNNSHNISAGTHLIEVAAIGYFFSPVGAVVIFLVVLSTFSWPSNRDDFCFCNIS